jgi:hypothetical protein
MTRRSKTATSDLSRMLSLKKAKMPVSFGVRSIRYEDETPR